VAIMGYIYRITNLVNGKQYIGQTILHYEDRWNRHIQKMERKDGCPALKNAMLKYGVDRFRFEVLLICFDEDVDRYETEAIAKYGTLAPKGYNISAGGAATYGFKGKTHSEETKGRISEAVKARFSKAEEREKQRKMIQARYAIDDEYRLRISQGLQNSPNFQLAKELRLLGNSKGRKQEEETKKKISDSLKKYFNDHEAREINIEKHREIMARAKGTQVCKCTLEGIVIDEYISLSEAARQNNVSKSTLMKCARNGTVCYGFLYKNKNRA